MSGRTIPREGFGDLSRDPLRCRIVGDAQRVRASPLVPQDDQDEQQSKVDRRDHEKVHGTNAGHMVAQERPPRLARPGPTLGHVLGDRRLHDLDPEFEQFAMDARCAPQWVLSTHSPDQTADLSWYLWPAATGARLPAPIGPESCSVPAHDRVGLNNDGCVQQRRHKAMEPDKSSRSHGVSRGLAGIRRRNRFS